MTERKVKKPTTEQQAIAAWLGELAEVVNSTGRHAGHTLTQVGRCVYCSCGFRYQGSKL